ncbi:hypothetical protein Lpp77_01277 [Lacticaseibacillus paracasei subsp. paracasei CNCM I-4270]|uniref:EpsG family protein n=1 Tax=Lacticaseibacillus paracasei subsp. paracasei CNCM I-4270 TaxID=1256202 RepID=A0A8E0IN59_LACPA|nr:hypothetical protein Lpp77_01277 [Lacticaseibacillus paracasei subsp. paracasei CNCM I-4270]
MLWLCIVLVSFISACLQKMEKLVGLVSFMGLGFLAGNPNLQYDRDALVYMQNYTAGTDYFEKGYNWITKLFEPTIDYQTFRLYSSLIVFLLMFLAILLMTEHVSSVSFFYAIAIFPIDKIQVRNCMGAVFILFGTFFLIKYGNKGVIPAFFIIFIGSLFHSLALYFLLLPVMWLFRDLIERYFSVVSWGLMFIAFILEILGSTSLAPLIVEILGRFGSRANAGENVSTIYSGGGQSIGQWGIFLLVTILAIITVRLIKGMYDKDSSIYYQLVLCALVLWSAALIFMTLSIDYIRILRISAFFYFIYIANVSSNHNLGARLNGIAIGTLSAVILMSLGFWAYGFTQDQILAAFGFI